MSFTSVLTFIDSNTRDPLDGVEVSGTASGTTDSAGKVTLVASDDGSGEAFVTASKAGYDTLPNVQLLDLSPQVYENTLEMTSETSSGGGSSSGWPSCFISTAAFQSPLAEELAFQHRIRNDVLLKMEWGREWWAEWNRYYARISPPIAAEMDRDPRLRELVRWGIVQPWLQYIKLVEAHPDWSTIDFEAMEPNLRAFLEDLRRGMDAWLFEIELPKTLTNRSIDEAVRELDVILTYGTGGHSAAYLDYLVGQGELPLAMDDPERGRQRAFLEARGHSATDIDAIVGAVSSVGP
jgi:hypothetical protein